jgi:hypothetical protein
MTNKEQSNQKVCDVIACYDEECPHRGDWEEKCNFDDWGMRVHYPYCYKADRRIPSEIGKNGYNDFPDWCPLQIKSTMHPLCPYHVEMNEFTGDCVNHRGCMFQELEWDGETLKKMLCMGKMKTVLSDNEE